jgi:hypothetical protein
MKQFAAAIADTVNSIGALFKAASDNRIAGIDGEIEAMKARQETEKAALDESMMGEEERAIAEKVLAHQQRVEAEKLEKKKKDEQMKQAQFEKRWALVQVLINTAVGVMKAAPAIPLMAAIAIMGAAQAAVIAAQPIPKYAKGTPEGGHPETGAALVGDAGKHEAIITPSGKVFKSPKKPTIVNLTKGTEVHPDFNRFVAEKTRDVVNISRETNNVYRFEYQELVASAQAQEQLLREIARKKEKSVAIHMDRNGFYHSLENERRRNTYLNYELHKNFS